MHRSRLWGIACGVGLLGLCEAGATDFYVSATSGSDANSGFSWSAPKQTIQAAADVALSLDVVWVSNGTYAAGGRVSPSGLLTNRLCVTNMIRVQSVNGPTVTRIVGSGPHGPAAVRCVYLAANATLSGFTLTGGFTRVDGTWDLDRSGAGMYAPTGGSGVSNCVITGNAATFGGGGIHNGVLYDCTLAGNSASNLGGGCQYGVLTRCTISNNTADTGGGCRGSTLKTCTLVGNRATGSGGGGAYLGKLTDCTLTRNAAAISGGGALTATSSNCTFVANVAGYGGAVSEGSHYNDTMLANTGTIYGGAVSGAYLYDSVLVQNTAPVGGGANQGWLFRCRLGGNVATNFGGGAYYSQLESCVLTNNVAPTGGGAFGGTLRNCVVARNVATGISGGVGQSVVYNSIVWSNLALLNGGNFTVDASLQYSCTTPLPGGGAGNITNDPGCVNFGAGDFHLQSNAPCAEVGLNSEALDPLDLDLNPRVRNVAVDLGAYEYQGPAIARAWLQTNGLATDGSAVLGQADADGMNNWQEYMAGTAPTNGTSYLHVMSMTWQDGGAVLTWNSVTSRVYAIDCTTNTAAWQDGWLLAGGVAGQAGQTSVTDTTASVSAAARYRVFVGP